MIVAELEQRLFAKHSVMTLDRVKEPRLWAAVEWIRTMACPEGYWGYASATATCLCSLALALWRDPASDKVLRSACGWLLQTSRSGTWETPWDSAIALRAIELAGHGNHETALLGKETALNLVHQGVPLKPHHAAQSLNLATLVKHESRGAWTARCREMLHADTNPYVQGQVIHALINGGAYDESLDGPLQMLSTFVQAELPSASTFLSYVVALQALAASHEHEKVVSLALDNIFTDAYRTDGSWYHEPWYTAWALCALHEVKAVRRLVIFSPDLNREFDSAKKQLDDLIHEEEKSVVAEVARRRKVSLFSGLAVILVAGLCTAVVFWQESNPLFSSGLITGTLLLLLGVVWGVLWPLLRD